MKLEESLSQPNNHVRTSVAAHPPPRRPSVVDVEQPSKVALDATASSAIPDSAGDGVIGPVDSHEYFLNKTLSAVDRASHINGGRAVDWTEISHGAPYPSVDLMAWIRPDASSPDEREAVVNFVAHQVTTTGSFNVSGHGVPQELTDRLDAMSREFFQRPFDFKAKYGHAGTGRGYAAVKTQSVATVYGYKTTQAERHDLRECYSVVYPPDHPANVRGPDEFQHVLDEYMEHMDTLDTVLHHIMTAALIKVKDVSIPTDLLEQAKGGAKGLFRATYFPNLGDAYKGAVKLGAHSDWGTVTIINPRNPGLEEIRDNQWVKVPVQAGELHVIVGELLAAWTNLTFVNNVHRVNESHEAGERTSYVYFCGGQKETSENQVGIPPVCAPGESPRFGTVTFALHSDKYLQRYYKMSEEQN
jgi:isopenicillin N synthase-like dioxygenase